MSAGNTNLYYQYRGTANSNAVRTQSGKLTFPSWLKIVRAGNSFILSKSTTGTTWAVIVNVTFTGAFAANALVGLGVTSGTTNSVNVARFANVMIS